MSIRWHTDPKFPPPSPSGGEGKELSDLVDSNSYTPLYLNIRNKIKTTTGEDLDWLKGIQSAFDTHVTQILHTLRIDPWDYDHRIRDEYKKVYGGESLGWDVSIRTVMGRLLTYKDIWSYQREAEAAHLTHKCGGNDWFWRRPEPKPIWNISCLNTTSISNGRVPFMTNIHPKYDRRVYHVTYDRPWGAELDPAHHWGVFIDQTRSYNSDAPIRVLMACCGEHVGFTEGCWIALEDDVGAIEGVIKPYQVYETVFDNVWSNNSPKPIASEIEKSYRIGTAFKDVGKYDALHQRIKKALVEAAPIILDAYDVYQQKLQTTLDTLEEAGDAQRDTDPFASVLTTEQQEIVSLPIRLQKEYNAIQCLDLRFESTVLKDIVNQRVFKVSEMLKEFTFAKMGGFLLSTGERISMLKTTELEDVSKLQTILDKIDATKGADPKDKYLKMLRVDIEDILNHIQLINSQSIRRYQLETLNTKYESLGKDTTLIPDKLDWGLLSDLLKDYIDVEKQTKDKQAEVNVAIKSLRTSVYNDTSFNIGDPSPFPPQSPAEDLFNENMDVALLEKEVVASTTKEVPQTTTVLSVDDINDQYILAANAYNAAKDAQKDPIIPSPAESNVEKRDGFKTAKTTFETNMEKQNKLLESVKTNMTIFAARLRYIDGKTGVSGVVKNKIMDKMAIPTKITKISNLVKNAKDAKTKILTTFINDVKNETAAYNVEQTANKTKAVALLNSIGISKDVNDGVKALLLTTNALEVVDALDQRYVQSLKKIIEMFPAKSVVDAAPKKDVDAYINAWNTTLVVAATALALALQNLLNDLNNVAKQGDVNNRLNDFKDSVVVAVKLIESKEAREKREADEAREKAEKERLAREKQLKDDNDTVISQKTAFSRVEEWVKKTGNPFIVYSSTGLSADSGFRNIVEFPKGDFKQKLIDNNVLLRNGRIPEFFQLDNPNKGNPYVGIYLETNNLKPIEDTWKALGEWLFYLGTSQEKNKEQQVLDTLDAYKKEVPRLLTSVVEKDIPVYVDQNKAQNMKEFDTLTTPKDTMFHLDTIRWNANSCWLDASFVTFFAYPQNAIAKRIIETDFIMSTEKELVFSDKFVEKRDDVCPKNELPKLHDKIVEAVFQIEKPKPIDPVCTLSIRDLWTKCVVGPLKPASGIAESDYNESSATIETILKFYQLGDIINKYILGTLEENYNKKSISDLKLEATSRNITGIEKKTKGELLELLNDDHRTHVWIKPVASDFLYQIVDTGVDVKGELGFVETRLFLNVDLENNDFVLYGVICADTGHYVTWVRDFISGKWVFINVDPGKRLSENDTWTYFTRDDLSYENNISVHDLKNAPYKPTQYFYIRKSERDRLLGLYKKSIPSTLWDSPFATTPLEDISKTLNESYAKSSNMQKEVWRNAIGMTLLYDDIILRYAYHKFSLWLNENDENTRRFLEIKMRKALVATQNAIDKDATQLGIKRFPAHPGKAKVVKDFSKKKQTNLRKRILGVRYQIDFSELEI
jgi:hypothetical protein